MSLTLTESQLSATVQARPITLAGKEASSIVGATQGIGCEARRYLSKLYDPQTDARFASLVISLVGFKIAKNQDVQAALVQWEAQLLALERDHTKTPSPEIRRAHLPNILPQFIQTRMFEYLDRLITYQQVWGKVISLVQVSRGPDEMDCSSMTKDQEWPDDSYWPLEEEDMDIAALADVMCH